MQESPGVVEMRRNTYARRMRLRERGLRVACPAGVQIGLAKDGAPGCRCRIVQETVTEASNPSGLDRYCAGDEARPLIPGVAEGFRACSIWQEEKRLLAVEREARKRQLVPA